MRKPSRIAACGDLERLGEAVHHPARPRAAPSSSRMRSVSAAASRVWMTSGFAHAARGADVRAEALALPLRVALDPEVVQSRSRRSPRPWGGSRARRAPRPSPRARRGARRDARPPCTTGCGCDCGDLAHAGKSRKRGRDRERVGHAVGGHAREERGQVAAQFRKVEVAVGIDEHGAHSTGARAGRAPPRSACASAGRTAAPRRAAPRRAS